MQAQGHGRFITLAAMAMLVAVVSAGCARRGELVAAMPTDAPVATIAAETTPPATTPVAATATPAATPVATTTVTPVPSPNLSAIDALIRDIDNDLGADASAGADEGSTP